MGLEPPVQPKAPDTGADCVSARTPAWPERRRATPGPPRRRCKARAIRGPLHGKGFWSVMLLHGCIRMVSFNNERMDVAFGGEVMRTHDSELEPIL